MTAWNNGLCSADDPPPEEIAEAEARRAELFASEEFHRRRLPAQVPQFTLGSPKEVDILRDVLGNRGRGVGRGSY